MISIGPAKPSRWNAIDDDYDVSVQRNAIQVQARREEKLLCREQEGLSHTIIGLGNERDSEELAPQQNMLTDHCTYRYC